MEVKIAKTDSEIEQVGNLLLQLRPHFNLPGIIEQIKLQQQNGYQIAYVANHEKVVCAAGFVIMVKLAWGKHVYIDDLVTDEKHRSTGVGKFMMRWIKAYAKEMGCDQIHLDSGVEKFGAHRFYLREGFNIASHHFSIAKIDG